jgi:iron only hydrogenase large subunit-like protein
MFGAVANTYYANKAGVDPAHMVVVSVMPCTAKKFECQRPEMNASGYTDVDYVLTTRELAQMIDMAGIEFENLTDGKMDSPLGESSGAADIFATQAVLWKSALRTVYEIVTGRELPMENLHVKPVVGRCRHKGCGCEARKSHSGLVVPRRVEVKFAVAHGLGIAARFLNSIKEGKSSYHFVEIMTCPGGCIGGGGQPRFTDDEVRKARRQQSTRKTRGKPIRKSISIQTSRRSTRNSQKASGRKVTPPSHTTYSKREHV